MTRKTVALTIPGAFSGYHYVLLPVNVSKVKKSSFNKTKHHCERPELWSFWASPTRGFRAQAVQIEFYLSYLCLRACLRVDPCANPSIIPPE